MSKRCNQVIIKGAREHNLKGIDLSFPRDALVTFTGVSGSGKSSLAFNTIYQEGQRRFLESLSSYARQFLGRMEKPKVDHVEGLSPTVSIDQKSAGHNPRSTVGTITEVLDYLRLLMARLGDPSCPECGAQIEAWSRQRIVEAIYDQNRGDPIQILAPVVRERKGEYRKELAEFRAKGFVRCRIDGEMRRLEEDIELHRYKYHTIELVIDRLRVAKAKLSRLREAVEQAIGLSDGLVAVLGAEGDYQLFSTARACPEGHGSLPELEPRLFSFNSPIGACQTCDGLGLQHRFVPELLVQDPQLTLNQGALRTFTKEGKLIYSRLGMQHVDQVGEAFGFDLDTPWCKLTAKQRKVILYGSGSKTFEFHWRSGGTTSRSKGREQRSFPGIIPHLEGVYRGATARHLDRFRAEAPCPDCQGTRLNPSARSVRFAGRSLPEILQLSVDDASSFLAGQKLSGNRALIGREILAEIKLRLEFLGQVGLGYLTLDRRANSLAGGEAQRIRLAAQVGSGLRGILYVLDEPSIGLHSRDHGRLLDTLRALRDRGNTVCVVEHDKETMLASDYLLDIGPGAGRHGGEVVAAGTPAEVRMSDCLTASYLRGERTIELPASRRSASGELRVRGARQHNLRDLHVSIPLGCLVTVTGVSGSGKSTLINHILKRALRRDLMQAGDQPGEHDGIDGMQFLDKVVEIDQQPIGRTPRSNPATYTKLWDHVRDLYAALPESRMRDYNKGRFSFNVKGGRCEGCEGAGVKILEMQFMAPVEVTCEDCSGSRFNPETMEIEFKGMNVSQLLAMSIEEAGLFFADFPKITRALSTLQEVGLGYLQLGQPSTTLSGGEAQRIKLASELQRPATGRTIYLLDEPTTGLHFEDIRKLLACLQRLVDAGNSVIVIEHNLDVIKCADWIIDLGPEGGPGGGRVVAEGTPEELVANSDSHTAKALAAELQPAAKSRSKGRRVARRARPPQHISVKGAAKNNLDSVDVRIPLDSLTVITGVSGSGKSSLAFDTLFAEGQRRFVESLSTYARRFLGRFDRAPVDKLEGLGPAIAIDQRASQSSPRSTVATSTEIHDYLRLLYARIGRPFCPEHGQELMQHAPNQIARELLRELPGVRGYLLAPIHLPGNLLGNKVGMDHYLQALRERWREQGFLRVLYAGEELRLEQPLTVSSSKAWPELMLVIDRLVLRDRGRIVDGAAQAAEQGQGRVVFRSKDGEQRIFTTERACSLCGHSVPKDPHPRYFSFNHHSGACQQCSGLGRMNSCDPALLVNHPHQALFGGAVVHQGAAFTFLMRKNGWYRKGASAVAKHFGVDLSQPFTDLPREFQQVMMYGAGERRFELVFRKRRAHSSRTYELSVRWKGLCRQIEEWYHSQETGKGPERYAAVMRSGICSSCQGERLRLAQRHVLVGGMNLAAFTRLDVDQAILKLGKLRLRKLERQIAADILVEIGNRLSFLSSVGLGYLNLDRGSGTLSGGEAQRIRLAKQLGNRLVGVLYVLDEPTIGLHPRDTRRLLDTLFELRDLGNTIVAVEHDEAVIRAADYVIDMGPGAGHRGGRVVCAGTPAMVARSHGLTGKYLRGELTIPLPSERRSPTGWARLRGAEIHNLKGLDVDFPLGVMTAVTGVSGSGKSSLVMDALLPALRDDRVEIDGFAAVSLIVVDQSPIGSTPASNPATYTGLFAPLRELYAQLPVSKMKGFRPGRFSFNVAGGRCDACEGKGQIRVEMHFLADVWVTCEICQGRRYNAETLTVEYRGRSIAQVLAMEVADACDFFGNHPRIRRPLKLLQDVGLGYLKLGQAANTLSGGEAQRIKLVAQLAKKPKDHILFLLDEPTTGLHLDDIAKLMSVLQRLVDRGDSVIVIEHHLDVIKCADHVIELGPEAGDRGGQLIASGTPEQIAATKGSETAPFLRPLLRRRKPGPGRRGQARSREAS